MLETSTTHPTTKVAHQSFLIGGLLLVACPKCLMSESIRETHSVDMYDHVLSMYVRARDSRSISDDEVVVMICLLFVPLPPPFPLMGNDDD